MQFDVKSWILLTGFIGLFADKRLVIQDSLVRLFQNVTADNADRDVSLYVSRVENPTRIVTFKFVNGHISMDWDQHMADNYSRLFMDAKRNIWIADVDETYERKFEIFSSRIIGEVELTILKTNSTTVRTTLKDNTQKGSALPENSYSTTERTPQKETTEKGDDCSDRRNSDINYASIVLLAILILMVIVTVMIWKKDHICAWIQCKKSVPQSVQIIFDLNRCNSTSFQLMWDEPDDGGSPLIKYIIQYCEVEISPDRTKYEQSKHLYQLEILPSDQSYTLSSLNPGSYYWVEVQAVNTVGMSSVTFIFKTKESATKLAIKEDETNPQLPKLSRKIESLPPRNIVTNLTDMPTSTGNDEQNSNNKSENITAGNMKSHGSKSTDECIKLLYK